MTDRKKFQAWVRWLRRKFRGERPVRVSLVPQSVLPGDCGECRPVEGANGTSYVVSIVDSMNKTMTRDTLWEEWSHYLRFHLPRCGDAAKHDEVYGAIFNFIKRSWADGDEDED